MTKNEFMLRFQMLSLPKATGRYEHHKPLKSAAVLIPIMVNQGQLEVLLTKRAHHLTHHPGQVSFPGGKVEPSDDNIIATALRETHEEIGLPASAAHVIGQLSSYHTISGYDITPVVALISHPHTLIKDSNEVAEIFHVPLNYFLKRQHHIQLHTTYRGKQHEVHFMPYQDYNIWGATAAILCELSDLLLPQY